MAPEIISFSLTSRKTCALYDHKLKEKKENTFIGLLSRKGKPHVPPSSVGHVEGDILPGTHKLSGVPASTPALDLHSKY